VSDRPPVSVMEPWRTSMIGHAVSLRRALNKLNWHAGTGEQDALILETLREWRVEVLKEVADEALARSSEYVKENPAAGAVLSGFVLSMTRKISETCDS
jgi:hypothetical protein